MIDQPSRFGRFVLGAATSKYNKRECGPLVRVLSVAYTDGDLSVLTVACHHTSKLHSLEFHKPTNVGNMSVRLLPRLVNRFPTLRSLIAESLTMESWTDVDLLCQSCPELEILQVSFDVNRHVDDEITDDNLDQLFTKIPKLRCLSFWGPPLRASQWGKTLVKYCRDLRCIRLDHCGASGLEVVLDIWKGCPNLECVSLRDYPFAFALDSDVGEVNVQMGLRSLLFAGIGEWNEAVGAFMMGAPNLETLYLEAFQEEGGKNGAEGVGRGFARAAVGLRRLKALSLVGLIGGDNGGVVESLGKLVERNPKLRALNLATFPGGPKLTDTDLTILAPLLRTIPITHLELYSQSSFTEQT
ncbi:hypothetical protein HK097_006450, partial [Rhizophlyctis rosea]